MESAEFSRQPAFHLLLSAKSPSAMFQLHFPFFELVTARQMELHELRPPRAVRPPCHSATHAQGEIPFLVPMAKKRNAPKMRAGVFKIKKRAA